MNVQQRGHGQSSDKQVGKSNSGRKESFLCQHGRAAAASLLDVCVYVFHKVPHSLHHATGIFL